MKNKKAYFISTALAASIFGSVIGFNMYKEGMISNHLANMKPPAAPVVTTIVTESDWTPVIRSVGFIEPVQSLQIALQTSGAISEINFDSGSLVKKRGKTNSFRLKG